VADYGAALGSPRGCFGNRIYNNTFHIRGKKFKEYPDYIPMAAAFFFSTSAGDNDVFGNDIFIQQDNPETDAEAYAFYIGNALGGKLYNNRITTNVTPIWVACGYGSATGTLIAENTISSSPVSKTSFKPVRMGWIERADCLAKEIEFRSNSFEGIDFAIDATEQHHSYSVFWTLGVHVADKAGNKLPGAELKILDKNGEDVFTGITGENGSIELELPEYTLDGDQLTYVSPYTVIVHKKKHTLSLSKNTDINIKIR